MNNAILMCMLIGGMMQGAYFGSPIVDLANTNAKGKPFSAKFEQSVSQREPNGNTVTRLITGNIYRDSYGRYRQEALWYIAPGKSLNLAYIQEPVVKVSYLLDLTNRALIREELLVTAEQDVRMGNQLSRSGPANQSRDIEGLTCRGFNIEGVNGFDVELWFSEALEMVLLEKRVGLTEERIARLYDIRRIEPDRNLFIVPADYKRSVK